MSADEPDLEEILRTARAAWPEVLVSPERFAQYLAERAEPGDPPSILSAGDLYLACACAAGDQAAIAAFLAAYMPKAESIARGLGAGSEDIEEIRVRLMDALLVRAPGREPGIASYAGRGRLKSWVRAVAARTAARYLGEQYQDQRRPIGGVDELLDVLPGSSAEPEIEHLRARFGDAFRDAFGQALEELSARERNLLRQHYIDELTIDQLGALYKVHRATAARWVAAARETLFEETRATMMESAGIASADLDSVLRLLHSQLDISIHRFLGERSG